MPNTIWLKGDGIVKEGNAGGTITPGHLVDRTTANTIVVHATARKKVLPMFALEADFIGKDISTTYASGQRVQFLIPQRGAEINALVPANAAAIVIGDLLESNGDGTLRKIALTATTGPTDPVGTPASALVDVGAAFNQATLNNNFATIADAMSPWGGKSPVARAIEAVDNSAGGSPARIRVEVM